MKLFTGSSVALITPMTEEGVVNTTLFEALVEWHIKERTQALVITGTTGEAPTLSKEEKLKLYALAVKIANKRVPIIANTGTNCTAESVALTREAHKLGVDGILAVTPYYNKPNQQGLIAHFKAIAASTVLPIILYNVPSRTGVNLTAESTLALAEVENIVAIKEASGDLAQVKHIIDHAPKGFALYSGNDDLYLETLKLGADGVISVVANLDPLTTQRVYETYQNNHEDAQRLQDKLDILNNVLYIAPNPVPVKAAMHFLGLNIAHVRLPLVRMQENELEPLLKALADYGLEGDLL